MLLRTDLMNVTICDLWCWFLFSLWFFGWCRSFRWNFFGCRCSYHSHQFLLFFSLFEFILINLWFLSFLLLWTMFWLSLAKIAVKLIPSRAALLIILVSLLILKISKKILPLILPKRIFLLFFFSVHKIIHFRTSSFSEAHLLYC